MDDLPEVELRLTVKLPDLEIVGAEAAVGASVHPGYADVADLEVRRDHRHQGYHPEVRAKRLLGPVSQAGDYPVVWQPRRLRGPYRLLRSRM